MVIHTENNAMKRTLLHICKGMTETTQNPAVSLVEEGVELEVGVLLAVGVADGVKVTDGVVVGLEVPVGVEVGELVGLLVGDGVAVGERDAVGVLVGDAVAEGVAVGVRDMVGETVSLRDWRDERAPKVKTKLLQSLPGSRFDTTGKHSRNT